MEHGFRHERAQTLAIARKIARQAFRKGLRQLLVPIDYTRVLEIPILLNISGVFNEHRPLRILDIGSPQILSLTLAESFPESTIDYANILSSELDYVHFLAYCAGLSNIQPRQMDARTADPPCAYDYVFCCSVLEHIAPEEKGEVAFTSHVKTFLTPRGKFVFSVPFYFQRFCEYRRGSVYEREAPSDSRQFFQRFYDEALLHENILEPSGLVVADKLYVGERYWYTKRIGKRLAGTLNSSRIRTLALGRLFPLLSAIFLTTASDYRELEKPYLAIYSLMNRETS